MKLQNRNRATLLAIAGGYVLYLAYEILNTNLNGTTSMPLWVGILVTVLFGLCGIAVLIFAWKVYRTKDREEDGESSDDSNGLK